MAYRMGPPDSKSSAPVESKLVTKGLLLTGKLETLVQSLVELVTSPERSPQSPVSAEKPWSKGDIEGMLSGHASIRLTVRTSKRKAFTALLLLSLNSLTEGGHTCLSLGKNSEIPQP